MSMFTDRAWQRDTAERTVATYVQTFLGLLVAGWASDAVDLALIESAAIAAVPAALAVLKAAIARKVPGTMSPASLAES